jgi:hypothetical protein
MDGTFMMNKMSYQNQIIFRIIKVMKEKMGKSNEIRRTKKGGGTKGIKSLLEPEEKDDEILGKPKDGKIWEKYLRGAIESLEKNN